MSSAAWPSYRALSVVLHAFVLVSAIVLGGCSDPIAPVDASPPDAADPCAHCDDGMFCNGVEVCSAGACVASHGPCGAGTTCDEVTDSCTTGCSMAMDADHDGAIAIACGGTDCDDTDPTRHPGATEVCDPGNADEDCDPTTFGTRDLDSDGFVDATCCNGASCADDCNDTLATVHPEEAETCNGLDDDCDLAVDETVLSTFVVDVDRDGHGDASAGAASVTACDPPAGYARAADDCNDAVGSTHPGAYDRCDVGGVDDDCSGTPNDPPGGCACSDGASRGCPAPGACGASTQTCVAGLWADCAVRPVAEVCNNGLDEDCDGAADDGCTCTSETRFCGSDAGSCVRGLQICATDGSWGPCVGATDPAPETCNDLDDDCDASIDEGVEVRCYADTDHDGYSVPTAAVRTLCAASCPVGDTPADPTVSTNVDCDPNDANVHPGQTAGFVTPRSGGGYDYDCSGSTTVLFPVIGSCIADASGSCIVPSGASSRVGYTTAAACGAPATFIACATIISSGGNSCNEVYRCAAGASCTENHVQCH